jgi:hypothetical protein
LHLCYSYRKKNEEIVEIRALFREENLIENSKITVVPVFWEPGTYNVVVKNWVFKLSFLNENRARIEKVWCASWARVSFPHIANEQLFFRKIQRELFEILKMRKLWKANNSCKISVFQHIFDIFSRKYQNFPGNHFSELKKNLNLSMQCIQYRSIFSKPGFRYWKPQNR